MQGDNPGEIVIYQGSAAGAPHRTLFSLPDSCFLAAEDDLLGQIVSVSGGDLNKIHISAGWESLLQVALWSARPDIRAILDLLRKAGASNEELGPYRTAAPGDIFFWLYYGRKFGMLRRICRAAKASAEAKIGRKKPTVSFHLLSDDGAAVVASSL